MSPLSDSVGVESEGAYGAFDLSPSSRARSSTQQPSHDDDLQHLIAAWPDLPPVAKSAVLATLKAVKP